jgi:hypothetical protein
MSNFRKLLAVLAACIVVAVGLALTFDTWQHSWLGHELAVSLGVFLMFSVAVCVIFGNQLRRW